MKNKLTIGLVYELREEFINMGYTEEETCEFETYESLKALEESLSRLGYKVDLIGHGKILASRLVKGETWDIIFSMAQGIKGRCREAQVPALLDLFNQPYILSDALTMAVSLDKNIAKRLVRDAGIPTAPFMLFESENQDLSSWNHYPAFVKPVAEGTSKGCDSSSIADSQESLKTAATALLHRFNQPILIEPFLSGREFTVGVIGNSNNIEVLCVAEITMNSEADSKVFSMRNKESQDSLCTFTKVINSEEIILRKYAIEIYRLLSCRDGCRIDFRSDKNGNPFFLEINSIFGLHPTNSDMPVLAKLNGINYDSLIDRLVKSGLERYGINNN